MEVGFSVPVAVTDINIGRKPPTDGFNSAFKIGVAVGAPVLQGVVAGNQKDRDGCSGKKKGEQIGGGGKGVGSMENQNTVIAFSSDIFQAL